jgi:hypothetical protein
MSERCLGSSTGIRTRYLALSAFVRGALSGAVTFSISLLPFAK